MRRISAATGLVAGDYNNDGVVDAADYVVWRQNAGTNNVLANNPTHGPVDESDYERWRANIGRTLSGSGGIGGVPEPSSFLLATVVLAVFLAKRSYWAAPPRKQAYRFLMPTLVALLLGDATTGQIVVDGTRVGDEAEYGTALSVQNTNTHYGNATTGDPRFSNNGSEIDQVFAAVVGDRLFVLVAGNLQSNFNKLDVFIDSAPGGVNQLIASSLPAGVDPYCCGAVGSPAGLQRMNGLRFDAGFEADHYLTFSNGTHAFGSPQISRWTLSAYYADLANGATGDKSEVGFQYRASGVEPGLAQGDPIDQANNGCTGPVDTNCIPPEHEFAEPIDTVNDPSNTRGHRDFLNDIGLGMAINNSNTAGVNAGTGAETGNPEVVMTGIEFSLPLSLLGHPLDDIKITAFINSGGHTNVSNQFSGVGVLRGNLGDNLPMINLATIAGDQFVTVANTAGDYNFDGVVDAADYVVWRRGAGTSLTPAHYDAWRANFGAMGDGANGASLPSTMVPEPFTLMLVGLAFGGFFRSVPADVA